MNMPLMADTRPRIRSGVSTCTSVWRTTTLTQSNAPVHEQGRERQRERRRQAEHDDRDAEAGHGPQQRPAGLGHRRAVHQRQRHQTARRSAGAEAIQP